MQALLDEYMVNWAACVEAFREAWTTVLADGINESFDFQVDRTHKAESKADDIRRKVEFELYAKALLPESRGDILGLLETVDRVLTEAERTLYEIKLQEIDIPADLRPVFAQLVDVSCACCDALDKAVRLVFVDHGKLDAALELTQQVDDLESESDHLERRLIRMIFKLNTPTGDKVLLKDLVQVLGRVADRAENVANRVRLASVKRRV